MTLIEWTTAVSAVGTVAIAAIVAIINHRQYKVSKDQMRLDLFDRRFDVYSKSQKFISSVMTNGTIKAGDLFHLWDAIHMSKFLFGNDIYTYLEDINKHAKTLMGLEGSIKMASNTGPMAKLLEREGHAAAVTNNEYHTNLVQKGADELR